MRRVAAASLAGLVLAAAMPAQAQEQAQNREREYCPSRPGLGTTPCTIVPGRVSVETALADWTREDDADARTDTVLIGDTLVRIGLTDRIEAQVGWTPFGHERMRDRTSGAIDRAGRIGDVLVGAKANLRHPDGGGFALAVLPFATIPVGREPIGAGDWGAGLIVPVSFDLNEVLNLQFSPEIDAAVDDDGNGRHLAFGGVAGLGIALGDAVTVTIETQIVRDRDPAERTTQALGALSVGWMLGDALQLDAGANAGLNHATPDIELYVGISRRF